MADQDVLSAKLEVKDSFTSQLNKFVTAVNNSENAFNKFMTKVEQSTSKMEQSIDKVNKKLDQFTQKVNNITNSISANINKSTQKIEQSQTNSMNNILKKYTKMGTDVQGIFKTINKDAEGLGKSGLNIKLGNQSSTKSLSRTNSDSMISGIFAGQKTESFLSGILSGNFTRILGSMSLIGAGITGIVKVMDTIESWLQQGYNILNTLSTGLLSPSGIYEGAKDAGKFEQNRVAMDILYGNNKDLGQKYYKMGVQTAKKTTYGEEETGELQKKLAGAHISYTQDQLNLLADIASVKPEQPLSKVGFSIVDAMYGRTTSLKSQYMLDNKEIQAYLKKALSGKVTDKETGKKVDASKWKDAFNPTGTVKNKQEYFDLLTSFVVNETYYKGLNGEIMKTALGKLDRLQGNWETLKAQILGIDANETGEVRKGSVIDALSKSLDNLSEWLDKPNVKILMENFGDSLGKAVSTIADTFENLLNNVDWQEIGKVIKNLGDTISSFVKSLTSDPEFKKLLDNLPTVVKTVLKDKEIEAKTKVGVDANLASGNYFDAFKAWGHGFDDKVANYFGFSTQMDSAHGLIDNPSKGITNMFAWMSPITQDKAYLTDANASTYIDQNPNLNGTQRNEIKDMLDTDSQSIYNITIGEVKTDSAEDLIKQLQNLQNNTK
jgi:ABC-type transporter Mla subunit MlaD